MRTSRSLRASVLLGLAGVLGCGGDEAQTADTTTPPASLLGSELDAGLSKALLRQQIRAFSGARGRNPETLDELKTFRDFQVPDPPAGMRWDYQPAVGSIEAVPKE